MAAPSEEDVQVLAQDGIVELEQRVKQLTIERPSLPPELIERILQAFVAVNPVTDAAALATATTQRRTLARASLVSRSWLDAARSIMHRLLIERGNTLDAQLARLRRARKVAKLVTTLVIRGHGQTPVDLTSADVTHIYLKHGWVRGLVASATVRPYAKLVHLSLGHFPSELASSLANFAPVSLSIDHVFGRLPVVIDTSHLLRLEVTRYCSLDELTEMLVKCDALVELSVGRISITQLVSIRPDKWRRLRRLEIKGFVDFGDISGGSWSALWLAFRSMDTFTLELPNRRCTLLVATEILFCVIANEQLQREQPQLVRLGRAVLPNLKTLRLSVQDDNWTDFDDLSSTPDRAIALQVAERELTIAQSIAPMPPLNFARLSDEDKHLGRLSRYEWSTAAAMMAQQYARREIKLVLQ